MNLDVIVFFGFFGGLALLLFVLHCIAERCPQGGLHDWKKTGREFVAGTVATHKECRKCGEKTIHIPMRIPY